MKHLGIKNSKKRVHTVFQADFHQKLSSGIPKKTLEQEGILRLLQEMNLSEWTLAHRANGAPYFENNPYLHLSISHSNGWVALIVDEKPVGIDIQTFSKNIKAGQDYFRNAREAAFAEDETALHLIWGAKEAFYKMKQGQIPDLKEEVSIFQIDHDSINLEYADLKHTLHYILLPDRVFLVYSM